MAHRLQIIAEDLRPLLHDRKDSLTSSGARLWDLIDEIDRIGMKLVQPSLLDKFLGAKNVESTDTPTTDETTEDRTDGDTNAGTETASTEPQTKGASTRKGNAAQRHAEAIARGEVGKGD